MFVALASTLAATFVSTLAFANSAAAASNKATPAPTKNPYGASFPVPDPKATDIVLTIKGSKTISFTMGQLLKSATTSLTIHEPFVKQVQSFKVISLAKLFTGIHLSSSAKLNTIALNDYVYLDTAANLFNNKAYLAVARNGALIPMDQGGPIRLVFADNTKYSKNLDAWNWSLRTIEVK
jgi:hypothetical protein